jgi:hypothetical protein
MELNAIVMTALVCLFVSALGFYLWNYRSAKKEANEAPAQKLANPLQLQAYERLALFAERIKLENLITRLYQQDMSARNMQQAIQGSVNQEFEHNITQQLYVAPEIWDAISKLKNQNLYIVNQLASTLPANATAMDLNKRILDLTLNNPNSTMNTIVLEAISYEAKKLL